MDNEFDKRLQTLGIPTNFVDIFWKQSQKSILKAEHRKLDEPALVVSDTHGNLPALKLAMNFSKKNGIHQLISLGDMVDYNPYNNEVLETILSYNDSSILIRGNHDSFFLDSNEKYRTKFDQARINTELVERVKLLNAIEILEIDDLKLLVCHSNPWGLDSYYIFPSDHMVLDYFLFNIPLDGFLYGHTHLVNFYCSKEKLALNPGSLGQSRGKKEDLTFAWLLSNEEIVRFYGINVDKKNPTLVQDDEPFLIKELSLTNKKEINFVY